jgi:hypothetical protein
MLATVQQLLGHPAAQSSIVPLFAAFAIGGIFLRARLSGLGIASGFLVTVYLVGNFALEPLTATRKLVVVGSGAPVLGAIFDLAFRSTRTVRIGLAAIFGAASIWVFWSVLVQQPIGASLLAGVGTALLMMWLIGISLPLQDDPIRAGAAGVGLGLGAGTAAILGASALLGQYGLALGSACGGFLLLVMLFGRRVAAGATVMLTVAVLASLVAGAAVLLADLPWWSAAVLTLVPLAVRLPLPVRSTAWIRTVLACAYALTVAAAACGLAYWASREHLG